ncbi:MAG: AMP-binding protein, partial [Kiritimatiellia bacterium]
MNANLFDSVRRISEEAPERIALIHRGNTLTYGELRKHVERRASELRRRGIGKGDRVVLFVPMGIRLYEILLAVFAIGAVAVFLDAWADPKRLDYAA